MNNLSLALATLSFLPVRDSREVWDELHKLACKIKREREADERSSESVSGTTTQGAGK